MSSNTKQTKKIRASKEKKQGRKRKTHDRLHGSTPSLDALLGPLNETGKN